MSVENDCLACACCGADIPSPRANGFYADSEELKCDDCAAVNVVSIDEDEGAYISFYRCEHGLRDDELCDLCEGSS